MGWWGRCYHRGPTLPVMCSLAGIPAQARQPALMRVVRDRKHGGLKITASHVQPVGRGVVMAVLASSGLIAASYAGSPYSQLAGSRVSWTGLMRQVSRWLATYACTRTGVVRHANALGNRWAVQCSLAAWLSCAGGIFGPVLGRSIRSELSPAAMSGVVSVRLELVLGVAACLLVGTARWGWAGPPDRPSPLLIFLSFVGGQWRGAGNDYIGDSRYDFIDCKFTRCSCRGSAE